MSKQATLLPPLTADEITALFRERLAYTEAKIVDRDGPPPDMNTSEKRWQWVHRMVAQELAWIVNVIESRGSAAS